MKNAVIFHGKPSKDDYYNPNLLTCSNYHWIPWIQKQLIMNGYKADTPEAPEAYKPQYELWVREAERFEINGETTLVGHSCGAGFWLRYLTEHPNIKVDKIVLVAPSLGYGWEDRSFFDFDLASEVAKQAKQITIITSDNDKESCLEASKDIVAKIPNVKVIELKGRGHFTHMEMQGPEFPELLEEILK